MIKMSKLRRVDITRFERRHDVALSIGCHSSSASVNM